MSLTTIKRTLFLTLVLIVVAICAGIAAALVGPCLVLVRGARALLGDTLTYEGNRLLRLSQRLADALERLDAAIWICIKG